MERGVERAAGPGGQLVHRRAGGAQSASRCTAAHHLDLVLARAQQPGVGDRHHLVGLAVGARLATPVALAVAAVHALRPAGQQRPPAGPDGRPRSTGSNRGRSRSGRPALTSSGSQVGAGGVEVEAHAHRRSGWPRTRGRPAKAMSQHVPPSQPVLRGSQRTSASNSRARNAPLPGCVGVGLAERRPTARWPAPSSCTASVRVSSPAEPDQRERPGPAGLGRQVHALLGLGGDRHAPLAPLVGERLDAVEARGRDRPGRPAPALGAGVRRAAAARRGRCRWRRAARAAAPRLVQARSVMPTSSPPTRRHVSPEVLGHVDARRATLSSARVATATQAGPGRDARPERLGVGRRRPGPARPGTGRPAPSRRRRWSTGTGPRRRRRTRCRPGSGRRRAAAISPSGASSTTKRHVLDVLHARLGLLEQPVDVRRAAAPGRTASRRGPSPGSGRDRPVQPVEDPGRAPAPRPPRAARPPGPARSPACSGPSRRRTAVPSGRRWSSSAWVASRASSVWWATRTSSARSGRRRAALLGDVRARGRPRPRPGGRSDHTSARVSALARATPPELWAGQQLEVAAGHRPAHGEELVRARAAARCRATRWRGRRGPARGS